MLYPAELQLLNTHEVSQSETFILKEFYEVKLQGKKSKGFFTNGAGGIRTPGTLSGHNSLAGSPIRPLSHRSKEATVRSSFQKNLTQASAGQFTTVPYERSG